MPRKEKLPNRIDETVAEIAAILARGFMRYKTRPGSLESDVNQVEESEALTEKRLACSPHQSVHAFKS